MFFCKDPIISILGIAAGCLLLPFLFLSLFAFPPLSVPPPPLLIMFSFYYNIDLRLDFTQGV